MANQKTETTEHFLSALPERDGRLAVSDLLNDATIPAGLRGFIRMELEIAYSSDLEPLRNHFQLSSEISESIYHTLFLGLASHSTVALVDATRLVNQATSDLIRYLSRPQSFILEMLSGGLKEISIDEYFSHLLEYLQEYTYFPDILRTWSERMQADGVEKISRSELQDLIRRIDRSVTGRFSIEELHALLLPLSDIFLSHSIPKEYLLRFFLEKGAGPVVQALRQDHRTELSLTEMLDLLAILLHRTASPLQLEDREPTTPDADYAKFIEELKDAGVFLGAPSEVEYLRSIEDRNSTTRSNSTHEN